MIRSPRFHNSHRRGARGFSLIELAVVTGILGVIVAIALPAFNRILVSARASAAAGDLRVFVGAFQAQAQQAGDYPPDAGIGVMPPLMQGSLGDTGWLRETPIGGRYNWESDRTVAGVRYRAAIAIRTLDPAQVSVDQRLLVALDRLLDDGNLATGQFFLGLGNEPVFIIER
jgi:prepilin-type N-terminal cleavage/methylation domain-containing protein